jgi:predicted transcriptional regulator
MLKDDVKQMIDKLPENCSIEDIQYTLYVKSKIEKGQKDIEEGNLLSQDEVKARMDKWLNKQ